jgi:hypothetical protein
MRLRFRRAGAGIWGVIALSSVCVSSVSARASPVSLPVSDLDSHVREASLRFAVPEHWIRAVMRVESAGAPRATSIAGAMGLMQVMPATWRTLARRHALGTDPYDPRANVLAGTAYLRDMLDRYGQQGFLAAYNAGPGRYEAYLFDGRALPAETRAYVARISAMIGIGAAWKASSSPLALQPARAPWTRSALFVGRASAPATPRTTPSKSPWAGAAAIEDGLFVAALEAHGR